jgi:hypothetical protein
VPISCGSAGVGVAVASLGFDELALLEAGGLELEADAGFAALLDDVSPPLHAANRSIDDMRIVEYAFFISFLFETHGLDGLGVPVL